MTTTTKKLKATLLDRELIAEVERLHPEGGGLRFAWSPWLAELVEREVRRLQRKEAKQ